MSHARDIRQLLRIAANDSDAPGLAYARSALRWAAARRLRLRNKVVGAAAVSGVLIGAFLVGSITRSGMSAPQLRPAGGAATSASSSRVTAGTLAANPATTVTKTVAAGGVEPVVTTTTETATVTPAPIAKPVPITKTMTVTTVITSARTVTSTRTVPAVPSPVSSQQPGSR